MAQSSSDFIYVAEYIKNVLYFAAVKDSKQIKSTQSSHYFCIDDELIYENYYSDFGPLNLGCVYRYCEKLSEKLKLFLNKQIIVHYASSDPKKVANAAFLMGCYGVLYLGLTPKDALKPLTLNGAISYRPFQDASQGDSVYTITILDCLKGIKKANDLGLFNFKDFNFEQYDSLDKIAGGDLNWIVPGKFLAFIGPVDYSISMYHPPEMYIDYFLENNVRIVIRLNKKLYDEKKFSNIGISHYNLYFPDGTCPPRHILFKFLQLSEEADCAIAVHCKAGLGRTGSLIGCYLIKHYKMTAREAIGWMRICRPGSVIGGQQEWLEELQLWLTRQGDLFRRKRFNDVERLPKHEYGIYSIAEKTRKRPVYLERPQKSPPPIQRIIRVTGSPPRPQASKIREALTNTHGWGGRTPRNSTHKLVNKFDQNERSRCSTRRGSGAGEPRISNTSQASTKQIPAKVDSNFKAKKTRTNSNESEAFMKNLRGSRPIPTSPSPTRTNVAIEKGKRITIPTYKNEHESRLNQMLTVTPHKTYRVSAARESLYSTGTSQASSYRAPRHQLGRSPSPSPTRLTEQARATNTSTTSTYRMPTKDNSRIELKKALSRLRVIAPRDKLTATHSTGAGSLDARRAPPSLPQRAPRVRSDERTTATQGDLLNCIKYQRRLRENGTDDKIIPNFHYKFFIPNSAGVSKKDSNTSKYAYAASKNNINNNTPKSKLHYVPPSREKAIPSKSGASPSRPCVSKGRKTGLNTYH